MSTHEARDRRRRGAEPSGPLRAGIVGSIVGAIVRFLLFVAVLAGAALLAAQFGALGIDGGPDLPPLGGDDREPADRPAVSDEAVQHGVNRTALEYAIHAEVNDRRTERGLDPVAFDPELREVARYHSEDMAERGYFAHVSPEGEDLSDRYEKFGYECRVRVSGLKYATGGENIAKNYRGAPVATDGGVERYETEEELAAAIVEGWMNSPSHRENLLQPYWENEGIGVAVTTEDGRTAVYATQNFC
ncbi:CAP domain-containing protein [Halegenticoccus soli]|uniref:CAP domain-containing protein n=1 Tax=Halegenticoccus soli TaxID=1985678 RepID=UPI000C6DC8CE|nr:CAP domain-containing protein [Halegenticoccus soli]